jgi:hypothetical protein
LKTPGLGNPLVIFPLFPEESFLTEGIIIKEEEGPYPEGIEESGENAGR